MKIKTNDLKDKALDWAVATIIEPECTTSDFLAFRDSADGNYRCSTDWAQGGPIIDREGISLIRQTPDRWVSEYSNGCDRFDHARSHGPTPLVAAMRCFVASKLGDEVEIPEELQ